MENIARFKTVQKKVRRVYGLNNVTTVLYMS